MKRSAPLKRRTPLKCSTKRLAKSRADTVGKLKKTLWAITRQIVFKRYGNDCYSCGAKGLVGSNLQCGHFIPSSICSAQLRYDLDNLKPQCMVCNIHRSGNWPAYEAHLIRDGINVAELKQRNQDTKNRMYDRLWYADKLAEYQLMLASEA